MGKISVFLGCSYLDISRFKSFIFFHLFLRKFHTIPSAVIDLSSLFICPASLLPSSLPPYLYLLASFHLTFLPFFLGFLFSILGFLFSILGFLLFLAFFNFPTILSFLPFHYWTLSPHHVYYHSQTNHHYLHLISPQLLYLGTFDHALNDQFLLLLSTQVGRGHPAM